MVYESWLPAVRPCAKRCVFRRCRAGLRTISYHGEEHNIRGDALCMIDAPGLQALGASSVGQRLSILRAIYDLKLDQGIPLEDDSYVPPCKFGQRIPAQSETNFTQLSSSRLLLVASGIHLLRSSNSRSRTRVGSLFQNYGILADFLHQVAAC